ncbi:MAG: hypothetical protein FJX78_05960 [Armatimonadetes bacterium]|nr:hypothetical protein [Armatimonadota bacterium]
MTEENDPVIFTGRDGKEYCDEERAVAEMLVDGALFIGGDSGPFLESDTPDKRPAGLYVNCNDFFFYSAADALILPRDQIHPFYKLWKQGHANVWRCLKEKRRPLPQIEARMKAQGIWTDELDALPAHDSPLEAKTPDTPA